MINFPALSVKETLRRVVSFNERTGFGLKAQDFERLEETAPPWPEKSGHMRTLRLRKTSGMVVQAKMNTKEFRSWCYSGENYTGVDAEKIASMKGATYIDGVLTQYLCSDAKTLFSQHVAMARSAIVELGVNPSLEAAIVHYSPVYGPSINRPDDVSWVVIDLFARRNEKNSKAYGDDWIKTQRRACADEFLAALWIYPEAFKLAVAANPKISWQITGYGTGHDIGWDPLWMGLSLQWGNGKFLLSESEDSQFVPEIIVP